MVFTVGTSSSVVVALPSQISDDALVVTTSDHSRREERLESSVSLVFVRCLCVVQQRRSLVLEDRSTIVHLVEFYVRRYQSMVLYSNTDSKNWLIACGLGCEKSCSPVTCFLTWNRTLVFSGDK